MADQVNIYTTASLVSRFCHAACWLKDQCQPITEESGSPVIPEQSLSVVGQALMAECPITNRKFNKENWSPGPWGCER